MAEPTIDEIKSRLDVADVVGAYLPLRRSGRSFKALCPFHAEKTPSFHVFPERGTWKCFGCGEGGDIFTFVQKRENLEFPEALRILADRAGVELASREARVSESDQALEQVRAIIATAELYFRAALQGDLGTAARHYLARRGVSDRSVERFGLGYAPRGGLFAHLQHAGYDPANAVEAGVAGQGDDGHRYELFRDRLIFPIRDGGGRTIAFGGRALADVQPKYLNGPQTALFDKSATLYALDLARAAIRQSGRVVVVEGYMDALMAHQAGFENVVATLGTSLTDRHLELLARRTREVVLALDADPAGQAATLRGLDVARQAAPDGFVPVPDPRVRGLVRFQAVRRTQYRVMALPAGLDPDDLIRQSPADWSRLVEAASPVVDYLLERLAGRHDLSSASGKRELVQEALEVIRDLANPLEQDVYVQRLASMVGSHESVIRPLLRSRRGGGLIGASAPAEPTVPAPAAPSVELPEAYALALFALARPPDRSLDPADLAGPVARAIHAQLAELGQVADAAVLAELLDGAEPTLRRGLEQVRIWVERLADRPARDLQRELEVAALKLRQERLRHEHRQVLDLIDDRSGSDRSGSHQAGNDQAASSADVRSELLRMLSDIAEQLKGTEAELATRGGVGSLVWRTRQANEIASG